MICVILHLNVSENLLFFFFLNNYIVLLGLLPVEIWVAFSGESQLQQSCAASRPCMLDVFSVSIIRLTLTCTTGSLTTSDIINPC